MLSGEARDLRTSAALRAQVPLCVAVARSRLSGVLREDMEKEKEIRNERLVQRGAKLFGAMLDRSAKRRDGERERNGRLVQKGAKLFGVMLDKRWAVVVWLGVRAVGP